MEIYLYKGGVQSGPFDLNQIGAMLTEGQCQTGDLAWCAGNVDWRPLGSVLTFADKQPPLPLPEAVPTPLLTSSPFLSYPLRTKGDIAGFWCIPTGWTFLKVGIPIQHDVEGEIIAPTHLNARSYPALSILAQSPSLTAHFPWLAHYMHREMETGGKKIFTTPGPARTGAYLRLIKALCGAGWSFVLQDNDTALLRAGATVSEYADALRLELSGKKLSEPAHVRLQGIRSVATITEDGEISEPLPLSEALGSFAH